MSYTKEVAAFRAEQAAGFATINRKLDRLLGEPGSPIDAAPPASAAAGGAAEGNVTYEAEIAERATAGAALEVEHVLGPNPVSTFVIDRVSLAQTKRVELAGDGNDHCLIPKGSNGSEAVSWWRLTRDEDDVATLVEKHASGQTVVLRGFATFAFWDGVIVNVGQLPLAEIPPAPSGGGTAPKPVPASWPVAPEGGWMRLRGDTVRTYNPEILPADLIAQGYVLPFDRRLVRGAATALKPLAYVKGGWPGYLDMGSTGERRELKTGTVTDDEADYLTGGPSHNLWVWADSHGSVGVHFRDKAGRMISIEDYPRASCYFPPDNVNPDIWFSTQAASGIRPDLAHYAAVSYVPFLASLDPWHLEEVQHAATYALLAANPGYRGFDKGWLPTGQTRAYAYALRMVAEAYIATKLAEELGILPADLLPSAYWARILGNNRLRFTEQWVKNGAGNPLTGCHFAVDLSRDHVAPWQQDMLGIVIGWIVRRGRIANDPVLLAWRENYEWHARQALDRSSGRAGYPRSSAVAYYYKTHDAAGVPAVSNMAELAAYNGLTGSNDAPMTGDQSYRAYHRLNLRVQQLNGIAEAEECLAYVDPNCGYIPLKLAA